MLLNIAICDDDSSICDKVEDFIEKYGEISPHEFNVEIFYSGKKLCDFCKNDHEFDLIFLDIVMKDMDGINVGNLIRKEMKNKKVPIAYMSSLDQKASEFSKIQPFRFYKKPLSYEDVTECLDSYLDERTDGEIYFEFVVEKQIYVVPISSIAYFSSSNKKVKIKTHDEEHEFYGKLSDIQGMPFAKGFISIHKSIFVNVKQITKIHFDYVVLKTSEELKISRSHQKEVRSKLLLL
jgi:DNA-binding LytR/AlgR family response regulator